MSNVCSHPIQFRLVAYVSTLCIHLPTFKLTTIFCYNSYPSPAALLLLKVNKFPRSHANCENLFSSANVIKWSSMKSLNIFLLLHTAAEKKKIWIEKMSSDDKVCWWTELNLLMKFSFCGNLSQFINHKSFKLKFSKVNRQKIYDFVKWARIFYDTSMW